jgi:hypothetical protein
VTILLAALLLAETMPNVPQEIGVRNRTAAHVAAIRAQVIPEARRLLHPGELLLALPTDSDDFLATAIVPFTGARAYNVGVDKNYGLARGVWPLPVAAAADGYVLPNEPDIICEAFRQRTVDVVVLPYFGLLLGALAWPPDPRTVQSLRIRAAALASDPRFVTESGRWLAALRPRPGACV